MDLDWGWGGEADHKGKRPLANHTALCHILICLGKREMTDP